MLDFLFSKRKTIQFTHQACFDAIEVDIHSHLIPGIDDGSPNLMTSIEIIRQMREMGFKKIITTPHVSELYPNTGDAILDGMIKLNRQIRIEGIDVELSVAAEYMINDLFEQRVRQDEPLLTLPNKHILVEMSHLSEPVNLYAVLNLLKSKGYTPVLAHPERYRFYNKNMFFYEKLKSVGCLFQVNVLSFVGYYGNSISECAWSLLNNKMVDFIGSDIHHLRHIETLKSAVNLEFQYMLDTYPFKNKNLFRTYK